MADGSEQQVEQPKLTVTSRRRGPGRPFVKGDPRINREGRRPQPSTAALLEVATHEDLLAMWRAGLTAARGGDVRWAALIVAYLDGKPVARNEHGEPGEFSDLADVSTDELRQMLTRVK